MIQFFVWAVIGGILLGVCNAIYESIAQPLQSLPVDVKHVFYNTYEENQEVLASIRRQKLFQSLISNVATVLLVVLLYWLCLSD